ncbi:hypothetical protein Clacol_008775 [Clathrus columnatus]|uniref:2-isopropylmalate synthase n=1 Tax=Clathrus columnatus TaxID=1419009 RepID=A0AAV5AQ49_9AGAM|nr:hypothetical protein Clacol_008775 [Clathrus columnatus]
MIGVKLPALSVFRTRLSRFQQSYLHTCTTGTAPSRQPVRRGLATVSDTTILPDPSQKYKPYTPILLNDRQWPTKVLDKAPMWLSTDLRDGNQALPNPMNIQQKLKFFKMLLRIGFKEIEVAYPSASQTEFMFVRSLIEDNIVPDDVWLQVLTPCRPELIKRTLESVAGAKNVIIHTYLGTARIFREVVFKKTCTEAMEMAAKNVSLVRDLTQEYTARYGTNFRFNFGVEGFSQAEPEFVLELCEEVKRTWARAGLGNQRITFNLAASVEVAPPNHFADQVEYFSRNISEREKVIISLHPHNDMGTAVAATQLGLLAGAERVEGCLLGHGERTGNVDLITMALNQFTQGISPRLDFSNLPNILNIVEECTDLPVNPRLPYSGKLAFTAFSGSHQDAIRKGFQAQQKRHEENRSKGEPQIWSVPYLPFDPNDIGCSYEAMIRVNSQSGKAGVTSLLDQALSIKLPREMQTDFYKIVQKEAERTGKEVSIRTIVRLFRQTYRLGIERPLSGYVTLRSYRATVNNRRLPLLSTESESSSVTIEADIQCDGVTRTIRGSGSNPEKAFFTALTQSLNVPMTLLESEQHTIEPKSGQARPLSLSSSLSTSSSTRSYNNNSNKVASFSKISFPISSLQQTLFWGVGVSNDRSDAGIHAIVSAVNLGMDQLRQSSSSLQDDKIEYPRINIPPRGQKLMMLA